MTKLKKPTAFQYTASPLVSAPSMEANDACFSISNEPGNCSDAPGAGDGTGSNLTTQVRKASWTSLTEHPLRLAMWASAVTNCEAFMTNPGRVTRAKMRLMWLDNLSSAKPQSLQRLATRPIMSNNAIASKTQSDNAVSSPSAGTVILSPPWACIPNRARTWAALSSNDGSETSTASGGGSQASEREAHVEREDGAREDGAGIASGSPSMEPVDTLEETGETSVGAGDAREQSKMRGKRRLEQHV
eukprot:CAMPEP_0180442634 /NCGR_PEP_ID=MMETSP1036_2-20121128/14245_1 /TAXON_ID=632150 /ORGANISM="Azadinium spinosum, Strain 3D9" /LENGTH=244 /DNA_ID=CAMNT_0022448891 /DNA_START=407 /DNA_END=1144 /DNA_ORIENTATION=-